MDIFKNVQKRKNEKSLGKIRFFQTLVTRMQRNPKKCKIVCYHHFWRFLVGIFLGILQMIPKKCQKMPSFSKINHVTDSGVIEIKIQTLWLLDDTWMIPKKNAELGFKVSEKQLKSFKFSIFVSWLYFQSSKKKYEREWKTMGMLFTSFHFPFLSSFAYQKQPKYSLKKQFSLQYNMSKRFKLLFILSFFIFFL